MKNGNSKGRYANMAMPYGFLYLNNNGSRWVTHDMRFILVLPTGARKVRLADCYESFGNFAAILYRYRGKRYSGLPKSESGYETRLESESQLPHIFHRA